MTTGSVIFTQNGAPSSSTYSYSTRPRVVPSRKQFPDTAASDHVEGPASYGNLMYDRRVVRGNTYALQTLPWGPPEADPVEIMKQREAHRKMLARKRAKEENEIHPPQEVENSHTRTDVQTELYLEEIADRIIEVDMECQTDAFLQKPCSPLFIPPKTGADVATQIEEGELFDFDVEVRPILEVLVGKTIEQSLLEVTEEEELANLQAHQFAYHELRNAELAELHRLEQQEIRRDEEKDRRKAQQFTANSKSAEVIQKITSRAFALRYLSNLIPSVFNDLHNKGFFFNITERGLINDVVGKRLKDFSVNQPIDRLLRQQRSLKNARFPTIRY